MVTAPLRIGWDEFSHDCINFLNDIHLKKFFKLDLSWCNDGANNFKSGRVELCMTNLEILKQDLDQAKLFKNENKGRVPLYYDGQKFEPKQR